MQWCVSASSVISWIICTDCLCSCTNFVNVAASETRSGGNIYPSSIPAFCCLFHPSPGGIIHYFLSSCLWFGRSNILPQERSENEVVSMVTRGANNGRRVLLTPVSNAYVDQPAQRKRNNNNNVSGTLMMEAAVLMLPVCHSLFHI